jgi:drug/metabolite transporter (DMT)-like permease
VRPAATLRPPYWPTSVVGERAASTPATRSWVLLAVGVLSVAGAAILIRFAEGAEPLAISFWRCAAGSVALAPFGRRGYTRLAGRGWILPVVAGAFLAVHFGGWISSLELTTVANSVLLVSTTPIFTAVAARYLFKERLRAAVWTGIALTLAGTALIALAGGGDGTASLSGDALALLGAVAVAGYTLAGEVSRRRLGIVEYSVITYGTAALLLLAVCLAAGIPLGGYPAPTWLALAGIVIGPQLLGHTILNFVLRDLDSTTVSVAVMAEPPIAIALAFLLFAETPSVLVYPAGLAILAGILLVSVQRGKPPEIIE